MKKHLLLLFSAITLFTCSCKIDEPNFDGYQGEGTTSTNTKYKDSYLPTSTGSTWTYVNGLTGTVENTEAHITGVVTPINGQNYYEVKSSTPGKEDALQYYYVKDKQYKIMATTVQTATTVEFFLLDDNLPVNSEWTSKMSPSGLVNDVPARTQSKIIESGITKTVLGKSYKNVIHTKMTVQYDFGLGDGFEDYGTYDYYLAKGVGLIETDAELFGVQSSTYLLKYNIK